jgi:hypothetical protein
LAIREAAVAEMGQRSARFPDLLERLVVERIAFAESASGLRPSHPHICTIRDIGEQDGETFIAMEFLKARRSSTAI